MKIRKMVTSVLQLPSALGEAHPWNTSKPLRNLGFAVSVELMWSPAGPGQAPLPPPRTQEIMVNY